MDKKPHQELPEGGESGISDFPAARDENINDAARDEIESRLKCYEFYHIIRLSPDIQTRGVARYVPYQDVVMRAMRSLDFQNKKVLDIGCRDGLFSFEAEKLGAAEIIAIDNSLSPGAIEVLIPYLKSKVQMHEVNIIDLSPEHFGLFDIVIFPGTLYHLRYPFWALKVARDCLQPGGSLIIETAIFRDHNKHAMLHCPIGYESPYEPSSCSFFNLKGLKDTLFSLGFEVQAVEILKDGLQNKQSNPHELVKELLKRGRAIARLAPLKVIDRATVVCRKSDRWDSLDNYWHGTHTTGEWK